MAISKFLPYQDLNNDGLIDACKPQLDAPAVETCPTCKPNPNAFTPSWPGRTMFEPFLNEKVCKYQITITTPGSTTGTIDDNEAEEKMTEIFNSYKEKAIDALLDVYNKEKSDEAISTLNTYLEHTDWYLNYRPRSFLKLLYSISDGILNALEDATLSSPDDDEDEDDTTSGDITVKYKAYELRPMLQTVE